MMILNKYKVTLKLYLDGGYETLFTMEVGAPDAIFVIRIVFDSLKDAINSKDITIWGIKDIPEHNNRWVRMDKVCMWDMIAIEKIYDGNG